jgi:hypothetical protein
MSRPDGSETIQHSELAQSAAMARERLYSADPDSILDLKSAAQLHHYSKSHIATLASRLGWKVFGFVK